MGFAYYYKGEYGLGILGFTKAIGINAALAEAYNNRMVAYYHKLKYDKTRVGLHKA